MTRIAGTWRALDGDQRLASGAAIGLLVAMFLPWYGLLSENSKTHVIYDHSINAFGDVSFIEASIFLVAAGVIAMLFARGDGKEFKLPGGDGTIVLIAGAWAALLIFVRVFSRPPGNGRPVGIEWGFFVAFVAAGLLGYAGWRMRASGRPEPPLRRSRSPRPRAGAEHAPGPAEGERAPTPAGEADPTEALRARERREPRGASGAARWRGPRRAGGRAAAPSDRCCTRTGGAPPTRSPRPRRPTRPAVFRGSARGRRVSLSPPGRGGRISLRWK